MMNSYGRILTLCATGLVALIAICLTASSCSEKQRAHEMSLIEKGFTPMDIYCAQNAVNDIRCIAYLQGKAIKNVP